MSSLKIINRHTENSIISLETNGVTSLATFQAIQLGTTLPIFGGFSCAELLVWIFPGPSTLGYCYFATLLKIIPPILSVMNNAIQRDVLNTFPFGKGLLLKFHDSTVKQIKWNKSPSLGDGKSTNVTHSLDSSNVISRPE